LRRIPRILTYHRFEERPGGIWPDLAMFERHLQFLSGRYRVLSLSELHEAILARRTPENAVVVTIDDGYEDFHRLALPLLHKYRIPATLYVTTDFVDRRMWFWWDAVRYVLHRTRRQTFTFPQGGIGQVFHLNADHERPAAWSAVGNACMSLGVAERERMVRDVADYLEVAIPVEAPPEFRPMTWQQVREAASRGIEIGSHTCSHPRLSLTCESELAREVVDSKRRLEAIVDRAVTSFCYPFGRPEDVSETARQAVVGAGYRNAVVAYNDSRVTDDVFALRRFTVGAATSVPQFRRLVSGTELALRQLMRYATRPVPQPVPAQGGVRSYPEIE
jgi:peptidoglycan/xylan/chitin deacetylase (PgdA/CDA1 family)